jgi:hypothetical protein
MDKKEMERLAEKILFMFFTGFLLIPFGFALNWLIKNNLTPLEPMNSETKSIVIVIFIFILFFFLLMLDEDFDKK